MAYSSSSRNDLFQKLLQGKLTGQETQELLDWLSKEELDNEAASLILEQLKKPVTHEQVSPEVIAALEARLPLVFSEAKQPARIIQLGRKKWLRYAAAILLILATGTYFMLQKQNNTGAGDKNTELAFVEPQPGKEGAVLTLIDGTQLVLDSLSNGLITTQNGIKVLLKNGQVTYQADENISADQVAYNTMSTPKGRQFQLMLPDGSKVWLNAASSIRYPVVFTGAERRVQITGEAYFEVAKNEAMPFRVNTDEETEIEVLGTQFNINSYRDEGRVNTTLLEGSVRVSNNGGGAVVLKPGQQAQVKRNDAAHPAKTPSHISVLREVDVEMVMAWKNGVFNFQDATLQEVMRQLERWYDIEVVYEKGIPSLEFYGKMGRDLPLSTVLRGLNLSKVNYRIEGGKRLVVTP